MSTHETRIHIDQLQQPQDFCLDVESQDGYLPSDIGTCTTPIHFEAHVRKIHEKIIITGQVSVTLLLGCARCLTPYSEHLEEEFEIEYLPEPEFQVKEEEIELHEADLDVSYYTGDSIALDDVLREQLLLLVPLQPLCRPDCAGLCPSCGNNLNEGACGCENQKFDPRLTVLEKLLPNKGEGER